MIVIDDVIATVVGLLPELATLTSSAHTLTEPPSLVLYDAWFSRIVGAVFKKAQVFMLQNIKFSN